MNPAACWRPVLKRFWMFTGWTEEDNKTKQLGHIAGKEMKVAVEMEQCIQRSAAASCFLAWGCSHHSNCLARLWAAVCREYVYLLFALLIRWTPLHPPKKQKATESAEACARLVNLEHGRVILSFFAAVWGFFPSDSGLCDCRLWFMARCF